MWSSIFRSGTARRSVTPTEFDSPDAIELRQIVKTFKTPSGDFYALKGINIQFNEGDFVGVTGKSGSGKSTLINMITGIDRPTSGEVRIGETVLNHLSESQISMWRGRNLGIVFQFYQLLPMLSLLENTMLPMDFCDMYDPFEREERALELLNKVGLAGLEHKMPSSVSGGQQQAAAIARALANDPKYLIADEPTGNLDSRTAEHIFEMFEDLSFQGKTIIMVTHDPALARRTHRQVILSDGEIINEWIAHSFPMLSHTQMLRATHATTPRQYPSGAVIQHGGETVNALQLVTRGEVWVELETGHGRHEPLPKIGPGGFVGEVDLLNNFPAAYTMRAGPDGADTVAIEGQTILSLTGESPAFRSTLLKSAQAHMAPLASLAQRRS